MESVSEKAADVLSGAVVGRVRLAVGGVDEAGVGLDEAVLSGDRDVVVCVDVEPTEDRPVELLAAVIRCGLVQLARLVEQRQRGAEHVLSGPEVIKDVVELVSRLLLVLADLAKPGLELVLGPVGIAEEVEVAIFLPVQIGELCAQALASWVVALCASATAAVARASIF